MVERQVHLEHISMYKDTPQLVKIITGVRRSGKSGLMDLFHEYLQNQGVASSSIIHINFEGFDFRSIRTAAGLHTWVTERVSKTGKTYILLDEIQMVEEWEDAVNSLRLKHSNDVYITGSNAKLLSGQLATRLSGRYVEIKMMPFSFKEFMNAYGMSDPVEALNQYMRRGGLPGLLDLPSNANIVNEYLDGVVNTIIVKDIATFAQIRDIDMLRKVIAFLASNIGQQLTASKIAHYLTSMGRKVTLDTIDNYLGLLEEAFIFYRAGRYDIKGKNLMKTNHKFYIVDLGLRNALVGPMLKDYGSSLENVVYLELIRRGYEVSTGKYLDFEIDFIIERQDEKCYIQVCASMLEESTRERELRSLNAVNDNYPKYILSMDRLPYNDYEGIRQIYIPDFLLGSEELGQVSWK
ncbi:ATP-binding protein [Sphaerochaeta sp.]|uniref:ATP-binding protein n=1 Tax=Sphaerochaeta sp. TaxID=1972642 RepID=UPI00258F228E|nr:ATP-binding protein [Sphaerochaeta sp.]MDD3457686.1 ATP-binding protein [Sphaerochaeta sp.]